MRINEAIRATEIRVIDKDGNQLGVMTTQDALKLAVQANVDLVEIAPLVRPEMVSSMSIEPESTLMIASQFASFLIGTLAPKP